jgi:hypothetical protein
MPFQSKLNFARKAGNLPEWVSVVTLSGRLLALPTNIKQSLKSMARDKHSSLLGRLVSYKRKQSFKTLTPDPMP